MSAAPRIQTTVVGSYPVPEWLVAAPSEQALIDATRVVIATQEQAEGSRQIVHSVEKMNDMTQRVSHATAEQKKGGELVVRAMENISEIARDNLARLVSVFRVQ